MSLFNIQVYKTYFLENHKLNVSTDYLLGYTSVISNAEMNSSNELGLSGKSIEVLKSWNELKKVLKNLQLHMVRQILIH